MFVTAAEYQQISYLVIGSEEVDIANDFRNDCNGVHGKVYVGVISLKSEDRTSQIDDEVANFGAIDFFDS